MASKKFGAKRLLREYQALQSSPIEGIDAHPSANDTFTWYYCLTPSQAPFEGGCYLGKLVYPPEYPMKPPEVYMLTPNGRLVQNKPICLSMSSFHPETWDPSWNASTILLSCGILGYLLSSFSP